MQGAAGYALVLMVGKERKMVMLCASPGCDERERERVRTAADLACNNFWKALAHAMTQLTAINK